jgi:hypothetical protein
MIEDGILTGVFESETDTGTTQFVRVKNGGVINLAGDRRLPATANIGDPIILEWMDGSWAAEGSLYAKENT